MNELVREWLAKAGGDYRTTLRESAASDSPNFDAVCFHAQQCIEKLMKAALLARAITPPRTHDLLVLRELLEKKYGESQCDAKELSFLTRSSGRFRYPGESATHKQASRALTACTNLRAQLLKLMEAEEEGPARR